MRASEPHFEPVKKRPRHLDPPAYLSKSPPLPKPEPVDGIEPADGAARKLNPTRYGDWERNGVAVDF